MAPDLMSSHTKAAFLDNVKNDAKGQAVHISGHPNAGETEQGCHHFSSTHLLSEGTER